MSESTNLNHLSISGGISSPRGARYFTAAVCIFLFSISFKYNYSAAGIGLVILAWFFSGNLTVKIRSIFQRKMLLMWLLFYGLHAISYFYSTDKDESAFDLVSKLSFLIFPIVLGTEQDLDERRLVLYLKCFIGGVFCTSVIDVGLVITHLGSNFHDFTSFTYNNLIRVNETNAVCMAWYTLTCIFILLIFSYRRLKIPKILFIGLLAFFQLFFLALSARLLIAIEVIVIAPVAYISYRKHRSRINLLFLILYLTAMVSIAVTDNPISRRYKVISPSVTNDWVLDLNDKRDNQHFTNVTLRLFLWKTALESIQAHHYYWYGCGNGDVRKNQFESINRYKSNLHENNLQAEIWRFNVHNMYIQALYMLGIPGLLVFLAVLFGPMFLRIKDWMPSMFTKVYTIVAAAYMTIESALQTQAGIIFFCSFSCIFTAYAFAKKKALPE